MNLWLGCYTVRMKHVRHDSTLAVHAGEDRHGRKAALTTEIAQTSVFIQPTLNDLRKLAEGKSDAYTYTRYGNPTITAAEKKIAALEGGEACVITSSGMSAEMVAILAVCQAGDEIVSMLDVYGGTVKLFQDILPRLGIKTHLVPFDQLDRIEKHFTRKTKMLFLESPTNPTLRCVDLTHLCDIGHAHKACVLVDNTFATPVLQKPLSLGADVVLHSCTKALGGHSDLTAGAVVGARKWIDPMREMMIRTGASLDPGAAYLLIRGLKTLELRVERACVNAFHIAHFLDQHSKVERVMYPGLPESAHHRTALRQMRDFGSMLSFNIRGGARSAERFIDSLKLWYLATSLGGVESTVSYPVLSSHVGLSKKMLRQFDISPSTIRLSVGIEGHEDLIADLEQALTKA